MPVRLRTANASNDSGGASPLSLQSEGPATKSSASQIAGALPGLVESCITAVADRLLAQEGVVSVVLLGSAARGELVAAEVDGGIEVFGDLEFLAVTEQRLPRSHRGRLAAHVEEIGRSLGCRNPLFHTEVLFRERGRLDKLPPLVFTHELKECGRVIGGADVLAEIPDVTASTLDRRNTHEILMKRLWALAEVAPGVVDPQAASELDGRAFSVALARNALDIPTVLLPEVGVLLPGYALRVDYLERHSDLPFRPHLDAAVGGDAASWLASLLEDRRRAVWAPDLAARHGLVVAGLRAALGWITGSGPLEGPGPVAGGGPAAGTGPAARIGSDSDRDLSTSEVAGAILRQSRNVFHESPITRGELAALAAQAAQIARSYGPAESVRWLAAPRKGRLTASLLHLHRSLELWWAGREDDARKSLLSADEALGPLAERGAAADPDAPFALQWQNQRRLVGRAWWRTVRLGDPLARQRMETALGTVV